MAHQVALIFSNAAAVMLIFAIAEMAMGKFKFKGVSPNDWMVEIGIYSLMDFVINPLTVFIMAALTTYLIPSYAKALNFIPWWVQFLSFFLFEDLVQYWAHRACHESKNLWWYHMAHHGAPYMGVRMSRRNSFLYFVLLPNHYTAALLVYLGFGDAFVWYTAAKNLVLTGAHSEVRWDSFLYRYKVLHPVAWVIERTISTPATHFAHHAEHENDGIGHYHGNYGNFLFFWDVLFGTALITRQYPATFGVTPHTVHGQRPWYLQLFYPVLRRRIRWRSLGRFVPLRPRNAQN